MSQPSSHSPEESTRSEAWLRREALAIRGNLIRIVCFALAIGLVVVSQARVLALACQKAVLEGAKPMELLVPAAAVAALAAARGFLAFRAERQAQAAAARVKTDLRSRLYRRLLDLGPSGRAGGETGPLVEAVTSGIEGIEPYIVRFLPNLALAGLLPPLVLLCVLPSEWRSGLVLLFSAPFIPLFMVLIGRGSEKLNRSQWSRLSRMAGHLLDLVQGLPDLRIFGAVSREAEMVARVSDNYRRSTMAVLRIAFLSAFTLEFFATVGTAVVAVLVGFRLLAGSLTLVDGLFVLLLAPEFYLPLRTLGLSYHARLQGVAAAGSILPLLETPISDAPAGAGPAPAGPLTISFESVSYRYDGERGGISGIDLELPPGRMTALAGESGAGKTTLVRLLAGLLRPDEGRITANGIDLAVIAPDEWRSRIALVSQHPFFFTGTIRENLLLGCPEADGETIGRALATARADGFVAMLPLGLDTVLGDRGAGLSGGEQRRLALARTLLRNAPLVILDEPTAGLDPDNERLVGDALADLAAERTLLVISHREETLARASRIVFLSGGRMERIVTGTEFSDHGWGA